MNPLQNAVRGDMIIAQGQRRMSARPGYKTKKENPLLPLLARPARSEERAKGEEAGFPNLRRRRGHEILITHENSTFQTRASHPPRERAPTSKHRSSAQKWTRSFQTGRQIRQTSAPNQDRGPRERQNTWVAEGGCILRIQAQGPMLSPFFYTCSDPQVSANPLCPSIRSLFHYPSAIFHEFHNN